MSIKTDDRDIWLSFKQGDEGALELLYNRHFKALGAYGLRLTNDKELVEDAIQDLFVDLWRRKGHLNDVENVRFYLLRSLRNQLIRTIRHNVTYGTEDIDDFLDYLTTLSFEQQSINHEVQLSRTQAIQKAMDQLSQRQREAVHLRFYQGLNLDESAQIMGIPKQVVKNLLGKAYAVLRLSLRTLISLFLFLLQA